jgi:hypothetical protein
MELAAVAVRGDVALSSMATERLEAEVQTVAAMLAAATCEWLLMIAELDRREAWLSWDCRSMAHWLSWKCGVNVRTGRDHVRVARELERLPLVTAEFAGGRLSYSKVRALTRLVSTSETEAELVELALVATASQLDALTAGCARVKRLNDPEHQERIHENRFWSLRPDDDGCGTITMRGPIDLLAELKVAVDAALEAESANDGEEIGARRFDAALAIAHQYLAPDPDAVPVATIVIRTEAEISTGSAGDDTEMTIPPRAHGLAISRAAYERLRCDAAVAVERALDDGSVERTRTVDAIPRAIRRAVLRRDLGTCRWPGCGARASVHVHHIVWRSRFGRNEIGNLVALCHYHHRSVHQRGWRIDGDANRQLTFTDRTGRVANERTDRRVPLRPGALAQVQAGRGFVPDSSTIATALRDRLDREWAVGVICHNDEIRERRN